MNVMITLSKDSQGSLKKIVEFTQDVLGIVAEPIRFYWQPITSVCVESRKIFLLSSDLDSKHMQGKSYYVVDQETFLEDPKAVFEKVKSYGYENGNPSEKIGAVQDPRVQAFEMFLSGVDVQFQVGLDAGKQKIWHNLTEDALKLISRADVAFRERPKDVEIDGQMLDPETATHYIKKHYGV